MTHEEIRDKLHVTGNMAAIYDNMLASMDIASCTEQTAGKRISVQAAIMALDVLNLLPDDQKEKLTAKDRQLFVLFTHTFLCHRHSCPDDMTTPQVSQDMMVLYKFLRNASPEKDQGTWQDIAWQFVKTYGEYTPTRRLYDKIFNIIDRDPFY